MAQNEMDLKWPGLSLGPDLTQEQAEAIFALGREAVVFALLRQAQMLGQTSNLPAALAGDPSTPSSQKAAFVKPNGSASKRRRTPGRKPGHAGSRRRPPTRVDRTVEHRAEHCPDCGGELNRCSGTRERLIEDIPEAVRVETVRHVIHRDFCPRCRKVVEPKVTEALPQASIGNGIVVLSAWLHYALGTTIAQILAVFNYHLQFQMSPGGLVQQWHRLAEIQEAWYEEILDDIQTTGVLHADETGWRVNGQTHWLWCFTCTIATLFTIERSRAGPVVLEFLREQFAGVLVSDFWYAYNVLTCAKQKCLAHLLREFKRVEQYKDSGGDWPRFAKVLKRLIRDGIRLRKRKDTLAASVYERRRDRLEKRLGWILEYPWSNPQARRLVKRLVRHRQEVFAFLRYAEVPFDNNTAERAIRGAVIMRKTSYNNRSDKGAATQSVLMSVMATLKQRGLNPVETVKKALSQYIETGRLPSLKELIASSR
jgi:transposase